MQKIGRYRWTICGLVFFATTINYLDRAVISLLKPMLTKEFHWTETSYANIVAIFQLCYAIGLLGAGGLIDKLGTRIGYALATFLWSLAATAHALVTSTTGFFFARGFLGVTEAGNFPAAIKTVAEWFPKRERAFATGLFNSGANMGAILAPLIVPYIAIHWGWRWAFIITGALGIIWLVCWIIIYEVPHKHKRVTQHELQHINSDNADPHYQNAELGPPLSWFKLLVYKQTWGFALGKFLTDPIGWFYLFWLPDFLAKQYHLEKTAIALPVASVYVMAAIGSILGGWLPMHLIKGGRSVFKSRRLSMLLYALCVLPVMFTQYLGALNMWYAVLIIGLGMASHQAWTANLFSTVSDVFPKKATASVTGIGGMFGALGGMLIAKFAGLVLDYYKPTNHPQTAYLILFFICSIAYITAWGLMALLMPKYKTVEAG